MSRVGKRESLGRERMGADTTGWFVSYVNHMRPEMKCDSTTKPYTLYSLMMAVQLFLWVRFVLNLEGAGLGLIVSSVLFPTFHGGCLCHFLSAMYYYLIKHYSNYLIIG